MSADSGNEKASASMRMFSQIPASRPATPLLDSIDSPADLKSLDTKQLLTLADELREYLLYSAGQSGGHFGANLGVVELTIALHYVLNAPDDKLVWDVGHQAYAHKVLTGRRDLISTIRSKDGLTAFPERQESEYDTFGVGHSSTSISAGLGMSLALRHLGKQSTVACVIGDGAMTGGMAFEAMNDAVQQDADIIVVLNDNDMSISQATGGFSKHLAVLWQRGLAIDIDKSGNPVLTKRAIDSADKRFRHYVHMANGAINDWSARIPNKIISKIAKQFAEGVMPRPSDFEGLPDKIANKIVDDLFADNLFKAIGFQYFGPFDGHDVVKLTQVFERAKKLKGPVLVHVHTVKGKGFVPAEADPVGYHAISKLPKQTEESSSVNDKPKAEKETDKASAQPNHKKKYSQVFGEFICDKAATDNNLMAITPAMEEGSGMTEFAAQYPDQFFDVAIAEQHAVTVAGGMATQGVKPIVAIYSTFLQRGYDQLIHDVALQNLDVMFAIDRAGLVGEDGATHAGVFDLAYMRCVPNMVIAVPKDENECYQLLNTCYEYKGVTAVRYPRGTGSGAPIQKPAQLYDVGQAVIEAVYHPESRDNLIDEVADASENRKPIKMALLAFGPIVETAHDVAKQLIEADAATSNEKPRISEISVANMRWVKPLDTQLIDTLIADGYTHLITLEEHVIMGGAGSAVNEYVVNQNLSEANDRVKLHNIGITDAFIAHGSHDEQLADCGLDVAGITAQLRSLIA
ncbi:1-deoxy-D-xylulose-5-phosphate synthase [Psychrobacter sp. FDAARGOS_221]|uniref:1-deoxy-D-xylulose-5-phosphate synthase n=1 Tax=Psychrobacter sp. FDAARGOS_221 TaxID=1975705 RepID=UPI0022287450|nr:1-deoxy-D-xylulose-5-phosphate synthase [Psychrobacter sp. FDAARGOS_221]